MQISDQDFYRMKYVLGQRSAAGESIPTEDETSRQLLAILQDVEISNAVSTNWEYVHTAHEDPKNTPIDNQHNHATLSYAMVWDAWGTIAREMANTCTIVHIEQHPTVHQGQRRLVMYNCTGRRQAAEVLLTD